MDPLPDNECISAPGVLEKFQTAGKIAQSVMSELIRCSISGANIHDLCVLGNRLINEECAKVYLQKKISKGVAFPVSIAPNDVCGHFSPLKDEGLVLADGDLVKIDFGVHIDGFPVCVAHSIIVGSTSDQLKLRALSGAYLALETAVKSLKPGVTNTALTRVFNDVAASFDVQTLEGVLSHSLKRFLIDSNDVILLKENSDNKVNVYEIKANDVFAIDVFVSANPLEGKSKESELRTTIFKQIPDSNHDLKTKSAKKMLNDVNSKFFGFGFSLNDFDDELV
jgi:curved DNA binding protein